jgi:hypothetical protein
MKHCIGPIRPLGFRLEKACPDCGSDMVLRPSRFGLFYGCARFPKCRSAHGAHENGDPLGIPANKETKRLRILAHEIFDRLWNPEWPDSHMMRSEAYAWMRAEMGLDETTGHIGRFDSEQCAWLIRLVTAKIEADSLGGIVE